MAQTHDTKSGGEQSVLAGLDSSAMSSLYWYLALSWHASAGSCSVMTRRSSVPSWTSSLPDHEISVSPPDCVALEASAQSRWQTGPMICSSRVGGS